MNNNNNRKMSGGGDAKKEEELEPDYGGGGKRTVLVGVKMDGRSRELLTWALVMEAHPGDRVIALHVINNNDIVVDKEQNSCLLSTAKSFDSVIAVYEGFCNLKQVDLKLKFCKGSSIRKILARVAKFYSAAAVIVGTSRNDRTFSSSASIAKFCAKKLPQDCSVLAVDNGKILFKREANMPSSKFAKGNDCNKRYSLLGTIQRTLSKSSKEKPKKSNVKCNLELGLVKERSSSAKSGLIKKCSICSPDSVLESCASKRVNDFSDDHDDTKSRAYVDVQDWLEREKGAVVTVTTENFTDPCSPSSSTGLPEELQGLHEKHSATCRLFKFQELVQATLNFIPENLIGKGGSSRVYKGYLPDGKELAVKILKPSEDVVKEYVMEIEMITAMHHKNIISLFGFCMENRNLGLVYDFLSRGSVEDILHGNSLDRHLFGWSQRYNVAIGVAEALEYLHCNSSKPVIHRDVKSSNILLFDDFEPQLSDFGLAKWASTTSSHVTCIDVAGTFGYLAPEYFMYGKVNDKIDVYAFGVVLLELLSGKKPICNDRPKGKESLVMWAKPILHSGKATELLDQSLFSNYEDEELERMVLAASLCIRRAPRTRPQMTTVVKLLQGDTKVTEWAKLELDIAEGKDILDDEALSSSSLKSYLDLALLDVEDDSLSSGSFRQSVSLEDYLQQRPSLSSSLD